MHVSGGEPIHSLFHRIIYFEHSKSCCFFLLALFFCQNIIILLVVQSTHRTGGKGKEKGGKAKDVPWPSTSVSPRLIDHLPLKAVILATGIGPLHSYHHQKVPQVLCLGLGPNTQPYTPLGASTRFPFSNPHLVFQKDKICLASTLVCSRLTVSRRVKLGFD